MSQRTSKLCGTQKRLRVTHPAQKQQISKEQQDMSGMSRLSTILHCCCCCFSQTAELLFKRRESLKTMTRRADMHHWTQGDRSRSWSTSHTMAGTLLYHPAPPPLTCHTLYVRGMRIRSGLTKWVRPREKFIYDFDSYEKYEWALSNYANDLGYIHQVCVRVCYYLKNLKKNYLRSLFGYN